MTPTSPRVPQVAAPANWVRDGIVGLFAEGRFVSCQRTFPNRLGNDLGPQDTLK